jgi:putative transposase
MNKRNHYSAEFKTMTGLIPYLAAISLTVASSRSTSRTTLVSRWKQEFVNRAPEVFKKGPSEAEKELQKEQQRVADLERKVGQLTYEVDWLKKNLMKSSSASDRKAFIELGNKRLTVKRQAELLKINRTSVYRNTPVKTVTDEELLNMRRIDEIHTQEPTWGYRTITTVLRRDCGLLINRKRVRRIMREMVIYTLYPNLSKRYHAQYIRPYLLRNLAISRAIVKKKVIRAPEKK